MVDKENQWDDLEYTEDEEQNQEYEDSEEEYSDDEYSDQGYDYEEDDDDDDSYDNSKNKKKSNQLPLLIIALLLIGVCGFIMLSKLGGNKNVTADSSMSDQATIEQTADNTMENASGEDLGDMFFEQAGGNPSDMMSVNFNDSEGGAQVSTTGENGEVVATVKDGDGSTNGGEDIFEAGSKDISLDSSKENNDIVVSYDKPSNINPFKPPVEVQEKVAEAEVKNDDILLNNTPFEIIEPPTASIPDENLSKLLQTQISGILWDSVSPSAIVNLNGVDTFVKVGDTISGYTIQSITEDKVQIRYKSNSYVASVGELFVKGSLDKARSVANLEKKFAGRYK